MIENGATLQLGIGAIPDQVLKNLTTHQNLGLHTEMYSHGIIPLIALAHTDHRDLLERYYFHRFEHA